MLTAAAPDRFHAAMPFEARQSDDGHIEALFLGEGRRPPLLTAEVSDRIEEMVSAAEADPPTGIIFRADGGGDFQAGVNLEAMAAVGSREEAHAASRRMQLLYQRLAELPCPVIAAVSGRCLGGGTELILACHGRIAADADTTAIALPEINLGLIPGYGGTQRLPRLIGQQAALNMILTGNPVGAREALASGLIDRLAPPDHLLEAARDMLTDLAAGRSARLEPGVKLSLTDRMLERTRRGRRMVRERYLRVTRRRTGGHYPAPELAIEAVGLAAGKIPLAEGLEREAEMLADLVAGDVHPNLLALLRARQALRRPRGIEPESGNRLDLAAGLDPPAEFIPAFRRLLETVPWRSGGSAAAAPRVASGHGVLRRLPRAIPPSTVEICWSGSGQPAGFPDTARRLIAAAGLNPVFTRSPDVSPGLALIAAYLREGDRLVREGWEKDRVDEILEEWGMKHGPFALAEALGEPWLLLLDELPQRSCPEPLSGQSGRIFAAGDEPDPTRTVDEVIAALAQEIERLQAEVIEPQAEGWLVLDVFVLGGPAFRGGVYGAARAREREQLEADLVTLARRYGPPYRATP